MCVAHVLIKVATCLCRFGLQTVVELILEVRTKTSKLCQNYVLNSEFGPRLTLKLLRTYTSSIFETTPEILGACLNSKLLKSSIFAPVPTPLRDPSFFSVYMLVHTYVCKEYIYICVFFMCK